MAQVLRLDEGTWRIEDGHVRLFLLQGTEKALVIDTGISGLDVLSIAKGLTDKPIELLNTHADPDHIASNGQFERFYMSPAEEWVYRDRGGNGTIIPVRENDVIDLGERPLRIIDIPGHTPGSIAILDEKSRTLFSGDSVQDGVIYMFGRHRNIRNYVSSMIHLKSFVGLFDRIYPSHGTIPVEPALIEKLIEGATEIIQGKAEGSKADVHGKSVTIVQFPYAGFYCD